MNRIAYILLAIILIFLFWIKAAFNIDQYLDLSFFDEAFYMSRGIYPFQLANNAENGPVYSLWYSLLYNFEHGFAELYFLNWKLMILILSLSLLFLLVCYHVNIFIATFLSVTFMWADPTFYQWPRVSNFCISIIAIGFGIANFRKDICYKFLVFLFTALIASYIRPEYFISFLMIGIFFIMYLVYNYKNAPISSYYGLLILISVLITLRIFYQWPMFDHHGFRSYIAFAQYFAVYYFSKHNITLDPWTQCEPYFRQFFGNATSVSQAYLNNPHEFQEMIFYNLGFFSDTFYGFMSQFIYPSRVFNLNFVIGNFLLYFILIYTIILYIRKRSFSEYFVTLKLYKSTILLIIAFIIPPLIACVIYYPREHYMFLLTIPLIIIFSLLFDGNVVSSKIKWINLGIFVLLAAFLLYLSPNTNDYFPKGNDQPNLLTIKAIKSLKSRTSDIYVLEEEGGLYAFLDYNFHPTSLNSKNEPFDSFILSKGIDIVWVTGNLKNHFSTINDLTFQSFTQKPEEYDFRRIDIPKSKNYLLINKKSFTL